MTCLLAGLPIHWRSKNELDRSKRDHGVFWFCLCAFVLSDFWSSRHVCINTWRLWLTGSGSGGIKNTGKQASVASQKQTGKAPGLISSISDFLLTVYFSFRWSFKDRKCLSWNNLKWEAFPIDVHDILCFHVKSFLMYCFVLSSGFSTLNKYHFELKLCCFPYWLEASSQLEPRSTDTHVTLLEH